MPMSDTAITLPDQPKSDKPIFFIGSSLRDLRAFPLEVKRVMGFAFRQVQQGGTHADAKALKGYGGGSVLEVIADHSSDTFRGVYTVRFRRAVYVLHTFQKKSSTGRKTPKHEIALVDRRLKAAEEHYEQWLATQSPDEDGSGDAK